MNHYDYLDKHLMAFMEAAGVSPGQASLGLIVAHGDKFYSCESRFEAAGIPFEKGVAIGLLTYVHPFAQECREQPGGTWVDPIQWIIDNAHRFLHLLP